MFRFILCGLTIVLFTSCTSLNRKPAALSADVLRIMPLGDSLTAGIDNNGAYRLPLYWMLTKANLKIDFVGSEHWGPEALPDKDNEGHGGWRIDQIGHDIEVKLDKYHPHIILLGAGGNDISQKYQVETAPLRLLELARRISKHSPDAIVIVQTRPRRADAVNEKVIEFNEVVREMILAEGQVNPRILFQDNYLLLDNSDIGPDQFHPNLKGNQKLAEGWFSAIMNALGR